MAEWRGESALGTWLAGILIHVCRERTRRPRLVALDDADPPEPAFAGAGDLDLERAIAALPDGAREVFVLFDMLGHTHDEISRLLGIAEGTSKSQLSRARRELRRAMSAAAAPADRTADPGRSGR